MSTNIFIFGSVFLISLLSLVGAAFLALKEQYIKKLLLSLVSFSTGALLATVFLHLLPEIVTTCSANISGALALMLTGIVFSFLMERVIHWHHCHSLECKRHVHPAGLMILIGDAVHNLLDGLLIATSYLVSIPLGISTTVAVAFHELPQEIGDFAVLLHSGFTRKRALFWNFLSALTAVLGALFVLVLSTNIEGIETVLLPLAAGNFLYIATADLIPELHKETRTARSFIQFAFLLAGIAVMASLAIFAPEHSHGGDGHDTHEHFLQENM
ncbi:MAG: ZIP family metal transporter [Candidatus Peribacteraceae bacterium]|jgi:zinc and cadmium transporter